MGGQICTLRDTDDRVAVQKTARRRRVGRQPAEARFDGDTFGYLTFTVASGASRAARKGEAACSDRADSDHRSRSRSGKSKPIVIQPKQNTYMA